MSKKSIFITGGAGYVGSCLVPKLLEEGHTVTVLDLMIYGEDVLQKNKNLKIIKGDIRDQNLLNEIIPSHDLYDYECKYTKGMSEYICPADLSINLSESIKDLALKVHKILNCRHYSRVDFLLDKNNDPWFLEINTLPGMTETSLLPKSLKASGIEFKDIIQKILNEAIKS